MQQVVANNAPVFVLPGSVAWYVCPMLGEGDGLLGHAYLPARQQSWHHATQPWIAQALRATEQIQPKGGYPPYPTQYDMGHQELSNQPFSVHILSLAAGRNRSIGHAGTSQSNMELRHAPPRPVHT
eukprot:162532-Chlamydomonas_euryale.AAC.2